MRFLPGVMLQGIGKTISTIGSSSTANRLTSLDSGVSVGLSGSSVCGWHSNSNSLEVESAAVEGDGGAIRRRSPESCSFMAASLATLGATGTGLEKVDPMRASIVGRPFARTDRRARAQATRTRSPLRRVCFAHTSARPTADTATDGLLSVERTISPRSKLTLSKPMCDEDFPDEPPCSTTTTLHSVLATPLNYTRLSSVRAARATLRHSIVPARCLALAPRSPRPAFPQRRQQQLVLPALRRAAARAARAGARSPAAA